MSPFGQSSRRRHTPTRLPLVVAAVLFIVCCHPNTLLSVNAKDCAMRGAGALVAWKHDQGSFQCVNCFGAAAAAVQSGAVRRRWHEYDNNRKLLNAFEEEMRDGAQLVLRDGTRDISILLRSDLCGIRSGGEQNFRQLYGGTFMSIVDCT